jgi:hypothetical protein
VRRLASDSFSWAGDIAALLQGRPLGSASADASRRALDRRGVADPAALAAQV